MSGSMHAESRRSYSWWWGSHISPKNSKWLQENHADMDTKVKAMIKLIEEDADSFARRAEMYYKKRPELMKLVEEFYRAYRALAERYDHATGALRHAHQTMAEAFPNHIPLALPDESPSISSGAESGSYSPEILSPIRALFDPDDMQKDALGGTAHFHTIDRRGVYAEENESIAAKKGLKQLNEMFAPRETTSRVKLHEGKVRKGLNFQEEEEEEKVPCSKIHLESKILLEQDAKEKENDRNEIKRLQQEVSQLSNENQNLKSLAESESKNLDCFRNEVQNLRDAVSKLQSEKKAVFFKNQLDCKIISALEAEIIKAKDIFGELQEEIIIGTVKLGGAEEECLALEKIIQSLKLDFEEKKKELEEIQVLSTENQKLLEQEIKEKENARNEIKSCQEELSQASIENHNLKSQILLESMHLQLSIAEVENMRDTIFKLGSEKETALLQNQLSRESISSLETEIFQTKDEIGKLHDDILIRTAKLCSAEEQCLALEKANQILILDIFGELEEEIIIGTVKLGGAEEECLTLEKAIQSLKLDLEEKKKKLEEIQVLSIENQKLLEQEVKEKENARNEIKCFQEELSQASIENQNLKSQLLSESMHLQLSIAEVENMRDAIFKLESEKESALLQNQLSQESISSLETQIFQTKDEIGKLRDDILIRTAKLCSAEEQCLALEKANHILILDIEERKRVLEEIQMLSVEKQELLEKEVEEKENAKNEIKCLQEELSQVSVENQDLKSHILLESMHLQSSRAEVQNMRNAMFKLGSEKEAALMQIQLSLESISNLETEVFQASDEIRKLHEDILMRIIKLCSTEEQCVALEKANKSLKLDVEEKKKMLEQIQMLTVEKQNLLEKEVSEKKNDINKIKCLQEELSQVSIVNQNLKSQILSESMHLQSSRVEVQIMRNAMLKLGLENEAALMQNQLSQESISNLETEIFQANDEIQKLHGDIKMGNIKLCGAEEQCLALEKENKSLKLYLEEKKKGLEQIQMLIIEMQNLFEKEVKEKENARNDIKCLQEELSQVSIDNQNLKSQIVSESMHLQSSRAEVQNMRNAMLRLGSEKEAALMQNQLSLESISNLETEIFQANDEIRKLHENIMMGIIKLCNAEEQCLALEKKNQSLRLDLEENKKWLEQIQMLSVEKQNLLEKEVKEKENARNEIKCLQEELSQVSILNQLSQESISNLGTEIFQAKDDIGKLHEDIVVGIFQLCSAEEQCLAMDKANQSLKLDLEEKRKALEEIQLLSVENQNLLEQEITEKVNARNEMKCLQGKILQLSVENQNLKSQIVSKSKHLDASRTEVQHLKDAMSKLECEREVQNQLSRDSIATLETEIFRAEDEISKLHEEVLMGIVKLYSAEEQHMALLSANHSLQFEVEERKRKLEELRISLQESEKQHVETERSLLSREQQYSLSQEKVEHMTLEIKIHFAKLKDIEQGKVGLEEEVHQLKDINYNLNKNILSYDLKVKHLQDEIASLKEINSNFKDEVNIHWEDRKVLQQELDSIKDNRNELDLKNKILIEQMEVASLNIDSLETLVKELQFVHAELIDSCRKLEDEKLQHFNKLKDMEAISEKNVFLENSLLDATMELEELRENFRVLEDFCEALTTKISTEATERAALASQVEVLSENVEKLSDKNTLLENSLVDANTELEGLRSKLRELEESIQFISDENSNILTQRNALFSQVESIQYSLADLETRHVMLEDKHANLEKEKIFLSAQVMELEDALRIKKKEHESLIHSSKICMVKLENQIHVLQENRRSREVELEMIQQKCMSYIIEIFILQRCLCDMKGTLRTEMQKHESLIQSSEIQQADLQSQIQFLQEQRDEEFEEEQKKSMNSTIEIFILQRCLSEMKENNFILSWECQRHLEASKCAVELISQLKGSKLLLKEKIAILVERNSKLRNVINKLLDVLDINKKLMDIDGGEEAVLQTILCGIRNLLASISDVHDENQLLHMELTVYRTLLKQNGLEKVFLGQELGRMNGQLLVLHADHHQLFVTCEKLGHDVNYRDCVNEVLKAELESLCRKLSDLSKEFYKLKEQNNALEEENSVMLGEALTLEHLYLFFRTSNAGNMQSLKVFGDKICSLAAIKNDHEKDIRETKEILKVMENENKQLKDSLVLLEVLRSRATILEFDLFTMSHFCEEMVLQVEIGENCLKKKSMELLRAYHKLQCTQEEVTELCSKLDSTNKEVYEAKMITLELEEKITVLLEGQACKDVEIDNCCEENRMLDEELNRLNGEVEVLRKTEHHLSTELQEKIEEVGKCEGEISKLLHDVQVSAVDGAVLEEKLFELAVTFEGLEICTLVQSEMLHEGIKQSNAHAFELKKKLDDLESENRQLKPLLNACLPLFISLGNGIATVEKQAHQLIKLLGNQDNPSTYHQEERNETRTVDHATMVGALELQNLISKVEALQKMMIDTNCQLEKERLQYTANLKAARREIEGFKQEISDLQEKQGKETSRGKNGQLMKDIELDQVSNSNGSRIQSVESEDQMLKLWETVDRDYNNSVSNGHDIEAVDELKSEQPSSEIVAEKELGVDKLEISREMKESQEEWNRRVNERLSSNAGKLFALQTSAHELKANMEIIAKSKHHKSSEHDTISMKLKEAMEGISELVNMDDMLRKKVDECSKMCNGDEAWSSDRRQISEQTRKLASQIERLELDLQKIHHIFPKLEEDSESNITRSSNRRPRVLLRDYIQGRRVEQGRKRGPFCGCIRPKTKE